MLKQALAKGLDISIKKLFYITDLIEKKEVEIQYCPTDSMTGDYMTKPLPGAKFN
jgi:hypothetical protein